MKSINLLIISTSYNSILYLLLYIHTTSLSVPVLFNVSSDCGICPRIRHGVFPERHHLTRRPNYDDIGVSLARKSRENLWKTCASTGNSSHYARCFRPIKMHLNKSNVSSFGEEKSESESFDNEDLFDNHRDAWIEDEGDIWKTNIRSQLKLPKNRNFYTQFLMF